MCEPISLSIFAGAKALGLDEMLKGPKPKPPVPPPLPAIEQKPKLSLGADSASASALDRKRKAMGANALKIAPAMGGSTSGSSGLKINP